MCNDYRLMVDVASIVEGFADLKIKIRFSEGSPNIQAREDIKITDMGPIIRSIEGMPGETDLVQRRWSWPGNNKRPVYNLRSDGREFASNRCLIVADGFYEFTDPAEKGKNERTNGSSPSAMSRSSASREFGATPKMPARLSRCLPWSRDLTSCAITTAKSSFWTARPGPPGSIRRSPQTR
jgi:putative SOS response-associated peptidase YedK